MAEIKLQKRVVYAGDVHRALLEYGWSLSNIANFINGLPKADVAPVRRGLRYRTGEIYACEGLVEIQCSECEETNLFDVIRYETSARYCPYCGAKWKRGADNGN